jgi:HEAT repeat protein
MSARRSQEGRGRSPADAATLLIELGRAVKACHFYAAAHPARKATLERSFRAWRTELERRGALELEVAGGAFRLTGETLGLGPLDELARALTEAGVARLCIQPDLGLEGFTALTAALALDPDERAERLALALAGLAAGGVAVEPAPGAAAETAAVDDDADLPAPKRQTTNVDPLAALGGLLRADTDESCDGALRPEPEPDRGAELVSRLRSLDECRDDARYAALLQAIATDTAALAGAGGSAADDVYRSILVLSAHATDSIRSERQRTLSEDLLFQLATNERLADVVQRACAPGPMVSVRATQILLQLGAHAVPHLLDALLSADDPERRGRINAILIAMGEKTVPEVQASLERQEPERARVAARLAGETQNPALVPYLRNVLREPTTSLELSKECAKALVKIGTRSAEQALLEALASPRAELATVAASCAGTTGSTRAFDGLVGALRRALRDDRLELAREAIRGLGRLGRAEALPVLEEILGRRSWLGRRKLRELQLAAAGAVGHIPGEAARACLQRAATRGDANVRRAARAALARTPGT